MYKRIYINARFLTQKVTGVQRYAREVVKATDALIDKGYLDGDNYRFEMLVPDVELFHNLELKHIPVRRVGSLSGHLWEQVELPWYARDGFLISLCNSGPIVKKDHLVTIHDAAVYRYPKSFSFTFRTWYRILFRLLGFSAAIVVTDSLFSKKELVSFAGIPKQKIKVVYLGVDHMASIEDGQGIIERYELAGRKYLLCVGSMNPNKNFAGLLRALDYIKERDYQVVIAGGVSPQVFANNLPDFAGNNRYIGYVTDEELKGLYENAKGFVFPSLYEGFGLPPLEAMTCGCPVVVSETASLPEACGHAVLYCDPYSFSDMAEKITQLMSNESLRITLRQKGMEHAKNFTWQKCARELLDYMLKVV